MNLINRIEYFVFNRVSIISTLFFNFYHLPFKQAVKVPIYLHRPKFYKEFGGRSFFFHQSGKIVIDSPKVYRGMIKLGFIQSTSFVDNGFLLANYGTIIFKGMCMMAQGSSIRMRDGKLLIHNGYVAGPNTKIMCYKSIEIGANTRGSWNVTICDYDYHAMKDSVTGKKLNPYGSIIIGENNWICQNALVLKNTVTPRFTTIGAGAVVSGNYTCSEKSILKGNPAMVVAEGKRYMEITDCSYNE